MLLVLAEDVVGEHLMDLSITQSQNNISGLRGASQERGCSFVVALQNLADLIKAQPHTVLGPPLDHLIETRIPALHIINLAINQWNVPNVTLQ